MTTQNFQDNYLKLVDTNLQKIFAAPSSQLAEQLPARFDGERFHFRGFGEDCILAPTEIRLQNDDAPPSVLLLLLSLYGLAANSEAQRDIPLKAFKEFPNSAPYVGAFASHTEQALIPYLPKIKAARQTIAARLDGGDAPAGTPGDFSFMVRPLPKIGLVYICYEADDDFPPAVTCLYTNNANTFMPIDGLADVGEYTSKKIIELVS